MKRLNNSLSPDKSATSLFLTSQKMYDPKKIHMGVRTGENSNFRDVDDYFDHIEKSSELSLKAKHVIIYLVKFLKEVD